MRRLVGFAVTLVGLSFLVLLFVRLWDLAPIHWDVIVRVFLTLLLLLAAATLLVVVRYAFFKRLPDLPVWPRRRPTPDNSYQD